MGRLQQHFENFDAVIKLTSARKFSLLSSKKELIQKIKKWFTLNYPSYKPLFWGQGSFEMGTTINPISENGLLKYDLDCGVYFDLAHFSAVPNTSLLKTAVFNATNKHTQQSNNNKNTCVRVNFSDGHHIDLPVYLIENPDSSNPNIWLAHNALDWTPSDPRAFTQWFNAQKKNTKLAQVVRLLKAWKNFRENQNNNLNFPSGFELSILAANAYQKKLALYKNTAIDEIFKSVVFTIHQKLDNKFECLRPTTPQNEDLFSSYSSTRKNNFLEELKNLSSNLEYALYAHSISNAQAIQYARDYCFGNRF
jgi:hypothetical protein